MNEIYVLSKSIHMKKNELKILWQLTIKGVQAVTQIKLCTHCFVSHQWLLIVCYLANNWLPQPFN